MILGIFTTIKQYIFQKPAWTGLISGGYTMFSGYAVWLEKMASLFMAISTIVGALIAVISLLVIINDRIKNISFIKNKKDGK